MMRSISVKKTCRTLTGVMCAISGVVAIGFVGDAWAARWSKPINVARTCVAAYNWPLKVAQNARGDTVIAWIEACAGSTRVIAVSRRAGHKFGSARLIAVVHGSNDLGVALDAHGGATIAWTSEHKTDSGTTLLAVTRQPGGRFGAPVLLDRDGSQPALATNPAGEMLLAWQHRPPPGDTAQNGYVAVATRAVGSARFGAAQAISGSLFGAQDQYRAWQVDAAPATAVAPDGSAIASWTRADGTAAACCTAVEVSLRLPNGPFGPPVRLSPALRDSLPTTSGVAIADADNATIAWRTNTDTFDFADPGMFASSWDGHAFSPARPLMRPEDPARATSFSTPQLLLASDGTPTVRWDEDADYCPGPPRRVAVTLTPGAPVTQQSLAPPNNVIAGFDAALDTRNQMVATWLQPGSVSIDKYYACYMHKLRIIGSIDKGPPITGPTVPDDTEALTLAAAPGREPTLVWATHRAVGAVILHENR